jgi:UDP-3-O-acyl-N-acetylglucosamine deacetylase
VIDLGDSRYAFEPGDGIDVRVRFESGDPRLTADARWCGDAADFRSRIAPARTFALARDLPEIARLGLARHVDPRAVVVVLPGAVHCDGPFAPDEPARHKLLDLVGDFYLRGGPPVGVVDARRPGHTANAAAIARALAERIVVDVRDE